MDESDVRGWLAKHCTDPRWHCHQTRYLHSWLWLKDLLRQGLQVLDIGEESPWSHLLRELGCRVEVTGDQELTEPLFGFSTSSYDLVTCMEVIEHLKDNATSPRDIFDGSGISMLLRETRRLVRPDGNVFVTTPNVCSLAGIWRMIQGVHPFGYPPHNRELSPMDVYLFLQRAGLRTLRQHCEMVWRHPVPDHVSEELWTLAQGAADHLSGDCIFTLCEPC